MQITHYFPGGNTPQGFIGHFNHIMPTSKLRRQIVLKGGPGVGKSTFMRRITALCENLTPKAEMFHCASDPDSLDAVSFPEAGVCILDGTAPHIVDPKLPGAADGILNLGEYLDEPALEKQRPSIEAIQTQSSARYHQAFCCLRACAALEDDTALTYRNMVDEKQLNLVALDLIANYLCEPLNGIHAQSDKARTLFLTAYTPQGFVNLLERNPTARVVQIRAPWGADVSALLDALLTRALLSNRKPIRFCNPLFPERTAHIYLPESNLYFTTHEFANSEQTIDLTRIYDPVMLRRESDLILRRRVTFESIERSACEALREAKSLHDELENLYVEHMDFSGWQESFDKVAKKIKPYFAG